MKQRWEKQKRISPVKLDWNRFANKKKSHGVCSWGWRPWAQRGGSKETFSPGRRYSPKGQAVIRVAAPAATRMFPHSRRNNHYTRSRKGSTQSVTERGVARGRHLGHHALIGHHTHAPDEILHHAKLRLTDDSDTHLVKTPRPSPNNVPEHQRTDVWIRAGEGESSLTEVRCVQLYGKESLGQPGSIE